jgi:hypothetical protein
MCTVLEEMAAIDPVDEWRNEKAHPCGWALEV